MITDIDNIQGNPAETSNFTPNEEQEKKVNEIPAPNKPKNFWNRAFLTCDLYPLILIIVASFQYPVFFIANFMTFSNHYSFGSKFAATVASYASIFMVLGKLMIGPIYDLVGYRWSYNLILIVQISVTVFTYFYGSFKWAFPVVLLSSFWLNGANLNSYMILSQRLFGVNNGPKAFSMMAFGISFGNMIGASGGNLLLGWFSFRDIFLYFFASTLLSFVVFGIYRPSVNKLHESSDERYDPSKV